MDAMPTILRDKVLLHVEPNNKYWKKKTGYLLIIQNFENNIEEKATIANQET